MKQMTIHFIECEHDEDLREYLNDIHRSGMKIIDHELNYEAETADVIVKTDNESIRKFKETNSCGFSSLSC